METSEGKVWMHRHLQGYHGYIEAFKSRKRKRDVEGFVYFVVSKVKLPISMSFLQTSTI